MGAILRCGAAQPRGQNKGICCLLLVQADYIGRARGRGRGPEGTGNCSSPGGPGAVTRGQLRRRRRDDRARSSPDCQTAKGRHTVSLAGGIHHPRCRAVTVPELPARAGRSSVPAIRIECSTCLDSKSESRRDGDMSEYGRSSRCRRGRF